MARSQRGVRILFATQFRVQVGLLNIILFYFFKNDETEKEERRYEEEGEIVFP